MTKAQSRLVGFDQQSIMDTLWRLGVRPSDAEVGTSCRPVGTRRRRPLVSEASTSTLVALIDLGGTLRGTWANIAESLRLPESTACRHIKILANAGLVETDGQVVRVVTASAEEYLSSFVRRGVPGRMSEPTPPEPVTTDNVYYLPRWRTRRPA